MMDLLAEVWPPMLAVLAMAIAGAASAHVILRKRDVRAAIGWVGLIWFAPFVGSALYGLFGINRISRQATELRLQKPYPEPPGGQSARASSLLATVLPVSVRHLGAIGDPVDAVAPSPLMFGNAVAPLVGGAIAYRDMIEAIDGAAHTIGMSSSPRVRVLLGEGMQRHC